MIQQSPLLVMYPSETKTRPHKNLHMNVHSSLICNNQKVETIKYPSTGEWINEMWSSIQLDIIRDRGERRTDLCYSMEEPWKHEAKWKKPETKGHILYNSIHVKHPECRNFIKMESRLVVARSWELEGRGVTVNGYGNKNVLKSDYSNGCITLWICQPSLNCEL